MKNWIESYSIFIVDGDFRDTLECLKELGIKAEMPSFIPREQAQISTEEANTSRLCDYQHYSYSENCCWYFFINRILLIFKVHLTVESVNARIGTWKYLGSVMPTHQVPYISDSNKQALLTLFNQQVCILNKIKYTYL